MLPPWAMITPSAPDSRHHDLGGDGVRLVLDVDDAVLGQPPHAAEEDLRVAPDQHRAGRPMSGLIVSTTRSSSGSTL